MSVPPLRPPASRWNRNPISRAQLAEPATGHAETGRYVNDRLRPDSEVQILTREGDARLLHIVILDRI